jgi:hypothetical protein
MSTELRNVPDCTFQNELTQTRFWGGENRMTCIQVTQRKPKGQSKDVSDQFFNSLQLTRHQARMLATELMLFAEGREVEEFVEDFSDDDANFTEEELV